MQNNKLMKMMRMNKGFYKFYQTQRMKKILNFLNKKKKNSLILLNKYRKGKFKKKNLIKVQIQI